MRVYGPDMRLLAVLDNAGPISYELPHNDLRTATFCLPCGDEKNAYCTGRNYVRLPDDGHETGLFRISGMPGAEMAAVGEMCTYSAEHVLATLLDDVIFGTLAMEDVPFDQAVRQLLDHQTVRRWALDGCDFSGAVSLEIANTTILGALKDLCGALDQEYTWHYDTTALPWRLSIRRADASDGCGIHYGRNMVGVKKTVDESQIVTRLYLQGGAGEDGAQVTVRSVNGGLPYIDADTIGDYWPPRCQIYTNGEITDPAQLLAKGRQVLESYKEPYVSYTAQALDLSAVTGQAWDRHEPGKMVRVMDDESGVHFRARIVSFGKKDMLGRPREATITIANKARDALDQAMSAAGLAQHAQDTTIRDTCRTQTALRASDTMVNELTGRIVECESSVEVTADGVRILNERTDTLGDDITEARAQILLHDGVIGILSERSETIDGRVTRAEAAIEVNATTGVTLSHRLDTAEAAIETNATTGVTLSHRIGDAESALQVASGQIAAEVTRATAAEGALGTRLELTETTMTAQAETIALYADTLEVHAGAIDARATKAYVDSLVADSISATKADIGWLSGKAITCAAISASGFVHVGGESVLTYTTAKNYGFATETWVENYMEDTLGDVTPKTLTIGSSSCQFYAPADATFDWSDIDEVQDAISAARTEGRNGVTVLSVGQMSAPSYDGSTKKYTLHLRATASNEKYLNQDISLDASGAYNAGVSAVTITSVEYLADTWSYDADYKGFTVSFKATASNGAEKTETIHDTLYSCYNAGYNSGEGSVDVSTHSVSTVGGERVMTIRLSNGKVRSYAV